MKGSTGNNPVFILRKLDPLAPLPDIPPKGLGRPESSKVRQMGAKGALCALVPPVALGG